RVSAASLGMVIAFGGAVSLSLFSAPAAQAQKVTETKEFVEDYSAAKSAANSKNWTEALSHAEKALKASKTPEGKKAINQIRIAAYSGLKKNQELLGAIQEARQLGGLTQEQQKNYDELEMGTYSAMGPSGRAKACELTKNFVNKYGGSHQQYAY